ncbi:PilZ domain-containing protein [Persephonella hydrogeniphila]|uniref:PilZ domain-containing protein n=1 Tax=Persephonella hydrogeniphila TaxID=198703 RepID=A0A285N1H9_9AQUI|nr:PilZ domain-containing protein [Persephonella hydrogeniphila]SNZ02637.1 PilZ domain-containing protein [Persephonella hydrogeniphila]
MDITKNIFNSLIKTDEFFREYKEKFVKEFSSYFTKISKKTIPEIRIKSLAGNLYDELFSFKNSPFDQLYSLGLKMYETKVDIRAVLSKVFMVMAKDFLEYLIQEDKDIIYLKNFISLIEIYLSTLDKANIDYIDTLQEKISEITGEKKTEETENIIDILKVKKEDIKVIDYFFEVPVVCKAKFLRAEGRNVFFDVSNCINKIFEKDHYVFIKVENLNKTIECKIKEIDYNRGILILTDFRYAPIPQEKRRYIRVRLSKKLPVVIIKNSTEVKGIIDDISVGGIGVFLTDTDNLTTGDTVDIIFVLDGYTVNVLGQIRYLSSLGRTTRAGIKFLNLSGRDEEIIGEFATKRQFEILKKLRQL